MVKVVVYDPNLNHIENELTFDDPTLYVKVSPVVEFEKMMFELS